ncbi:MAG: NADP-dependent malic enzyme [Alphaproteobacteria bacterium]
MSKSRGTGDSGIAERAIELHAKYRGKVQMLPKCPVEGAKDFSIWYTPGVAAPCLEIQRDAQRAYDLTNRGNTVAVVSDGSRVLGLGDIGPLAGLPVMEGKALLFKFLGGVDAVPICIKARSADQIVSVVEALEPSFGAINLEDISQPKCFDVLAQLRGSLSIPVWHDDQQGTAAVVLGALINALDVVGKKLDDVKIAMIGMGAANVANYRILKAAGVTTGNIIACDSVGILGRERTDVEEQQVAFRDKWRVCTETNSERVSGGIPEALRGADVCIAFSQSGPGVIKPEWISAMAKDAIVFACANPVPEIWPQDALAAGVRIAATGRGDFPNQVNNALAFPGVFRGALDVRTRAITDEMAIAVARALAKRAGENETISATRLLPTLGELDVAAHVAAATGLEAQRLGLATISLSEQTLYQQALTTIKAARESCARLWPTQR